MNHEERAVLVKQRVIFAGIIFLTVFLTGCMVGEKNSGGMSDVEFTVMKKDDLPEEVKEMINGNEQEEFQMTCGWEKELYLMRGYGIQSTGGYSIQVEYVTENEKELHIKTHLMGPGSREMRKQGISCPYIVVKVDNSGKTVIFD